MKRFLLLLLGIMLTVGTFSACEACSSCNCADLVTPSGGNEEPDDNEEENGGENNGDENEERFYTVTFQQDGRQDIVKEVKEGETLTDIPQPWSEKVGYTVVWEDVSLENIRQNITVRAIERANTYTITFNGNGGTPSALTQEVTYDSVPGAFATATRENYRFSYWYHLDEDTPIFPNNPWKIADDVTFTAKWVEISTESTAKKYTITFEYGDGTRQTRTVQEGGTLYDFPSMGEQSEGYDYAWKTLDDKDAVFSNITSDFTVKLVKTAKKYPVTFDGNGGTVTPTEIEQTYDNNYVLPTPSKMGYIFDGWFTAQTGGEKITESTTVKITAAQTLYAQWTAIQSTVTFDGNGGTVMTAKIKQMYDGSYVLPETNPTRAGYTFVGWFTEVNGGTEITADMKVVITSDITLYAQWTAIQSTVTFDGNGGTVTTEKIEQTYDSNYILPETNPTRTGYTFDGWFTGVNGGTEITADTKVAITSDITLYAQWTAIQSTITFDGNGGTVTTAKIEQTYDSKYELPEAPTKEGYTFVGWFTEVNGGTEITKDMTVKIIAAQTLYAHWTINTYPVTFMYDNNIVATQNVQHNNRVEEITTWNNFPIGQEIVDIYVNEEMTQPYDFATGVTDTLTLYVKTQAIIYHITVNNDGDTPLDTTAVYNGAYALSENPTKDGYNFVGYEMNGEVFASSGKFTYTTDVVVEVIWKKIEGYNKSTVSFYDGEVQIDALTQVLKNGTSLVADTLKDAPEKIGYTFNGWYTNKELTTAYATQAITNDTTLYAKYTANAYDVTFDGNGGTVTTVEIKQTYDSKYELPENPTKEGYTFNGWFTAAQDGTEITADTKVTITSAQTLYAQWTANTYPVTFDGNGGTPTTTNIEQTYNSNYVLPETNPTRMGYTFVGWFTAMQDGTQVTADTTVKITAAQTLYAQWTAIESTVTFDGNGGTVTTTKIEQTYDNNYVLPKTNPTRTGYDFKGWFTKASGGTQIKADTKVEITSAQTLYAQWTAIESTVTFDGNGGTVTTTNIEQTYDNNYVLPEIEPTRTGYDFKGWFTAKTDGEEITTDTKVEITSAQTLYAQWTANTYDVTFNANGGTPTTTEIKQTYDSNYKLPEAPTQEGYTFNGWFTEVSGGTQIKADTKVEITSAQTLYAQWTAKNYTLTFDANGGDAIANTVSVTYDVAVDELPTPTRAHHTFLGWNTDEDGTGTTIEQGDVWKLDSDTTLYAQWKEDEKVTITFMQSGEKVQTISLYKGESVEKLPDLTSVVGHTVTWSKSLQDLQNVQSDMEVTAVTTPITYTVSLNAGEGTFEAGSQITANATYLSVPTWETPTRTGYKFKGWYTSADEFVDISKEWNKTEENLVLTAKWEAKTFTVQYVVDDVVQATKTYTYGESYTLYTPKNTNSRRDFISWKMVLADNTFEEMEMTGTWTYDGEETTLTFVPIWYYWVGPY